MILLDTNVISELMRPQPNASVAAWVASRPRGSLYTTSLNQAEILFGIAMLIPSSLVRANLPIFNRRICA